MNHRNYCIPLSKVNKSDVGLAGGKAASLGEMIQAGLPVPAGFVVSTPAYHEQRSHMSDLFKSEILSAYDSLNSEFVAVRSSGVAEDSPDASWAGQFESYLNVNRQNLLDRVADCWNSAASQSVAAYARNYSLGRDQLALAVVVQAMVNGDCAGVAFSANPVTGNRHEIMVEATYGLGELLVQGAVTPDNYLVSKPDFKVVSRHIPPKTTKLTFVGGQNRQVPVPEDLAHQPCLSDAQVAELARLVSRIEQHYGSPQDVEWAKENARFYIVQSRPVTTL